MAARAVEYIKDKKLPVARSFEKCIKTLIEPAIFQGITTQ
jgi:hypothetical protein